MKELLIIAISSALVSNVVLSQFLGICSFVGVSKKVETAAGMGGAVIFVITIASIVANLIYQFVLAPLGIDYLKTIVFILVIAALVQIVEMFLKKCMVSLYNALGVFPSADYNKLCRSWCCPDKRPERIWIFTECGKWCWYSRWLYHLHRASGRYP